MTTTVVATKSPAPKTSQASQGSPSSPARTGDQTIPHASQRELLKWMFQFVRPVRLLALVACIWIILGTGIEIMVPRQMGQVIDLIKGLVQDKGGADQGFWPWLLSGGGKASQVRSAVLILVGLVTSSAITGYLRNVAAMKFSMGMVYYIREATYDKLQRVGFSFHDTVTTGQLINRSLSDLNNVRTFLQTSILQVLDIVLIVVGFIILLLTRQPWVALVALIPLPIWTWYILRFSKRVQPSAKAVMESQDRNTQVITENIAGVHVVKAFATEKSEVRKYGSSCDDFYTNVRKRIRLFANFNPVIRSIAVATQLGLTLATAIMILYGKMTVGDFLVVGWAMNAILGRLQQVSSINEQYQNAIVSAQRLYEILAAKPAVQEAANAEPLPRGSGAVRFEDVVFGYKPDKAVLSEVSFEVPAGKMVAIVGPTGAGKSTLVALLSRFYDPQAGRITIDGVDIRDVQVSSLRSEITYVFQETFLFSDTVANNIAYGKPDASEGEIEMAARLAQAHEFIEELPKGYQTVLAEKGASLSGGQRQRLAIARAILKNPRILVLDDATAAVDPETEDLIRRGMRFAMQGRTTFVIAHRLSTAQAADMVIVLEDGRVTQMGTHDQLLRQDGHYRDIAAVQLHGDEDIEVAASPSHMKRIHSPKTYVATGTVQEDEQRGEEVMQ